MPVLRERDVQYVKAALPLPIQHFMREYPVVLAGGFIRSVVTRTPIKDVDLFVLNDTSGTLPDLATAFVNDTSASQTHAGTKSVTLTYGMTIVQLIRLNSQLEYTPEEVISTFDYACCQACVYVLPELNEWQSVVTDDFYPDCASRTLTYTGNPDVTMVMSSLHRMRRFLGQGWTITNESLAKLVCESARANANDIDEMAQRLKKVTGQS